MTLLAHPDCPDCGHVLICNAASEEGVKCTREATGRLDLSGALLVFCDEHRSSYALAWNLGVLAGQGLVPLSARGWR